MFENFPYTNFHDLNLDFIIQKIMESYSPDNPPPVGLVLSVDGMTGEVVLFREQNVQLPSIDETSWNFYRISNEVATGLKFTKGQAMERVDGANRYKVYDEGNPPPTGEVASVDGMTGNVKTWANSEYQTLQTPTPAPGYIWDLRRQLNNGDRVGIEFEFDPVNEIYKAYLKYTPSGGVPARVELLSTANMPQSGVVSVNTKTGIVNLYATDIPLSDQSQETIKQAIDTLITSVASKYTMPVNGIPASDLAPGVIPDLSPYYILPAGGIPASELAGDIPASKLASGVIPDVSIYQPKPAQTGTAGQVLGLDNNLAPVWLTPSGSGDISDLVQIHTYSTSSFTINSGDKTGLTKTDFGITAITGYTPIAIMGATASYLTAYLAGFDVSQVLTNNAFIWFKSSISAGQATTTTATVTILWIKTEAIHAEG